MVKVNIQNFLRFSKTHWYATSMIILSILVFILIIIGYFVKIDGIKEKVNTYTPNVNNYMTGLVIGQQHTSRIDNFYCPEGTTTIPIHPIGDAKTLNDDLGGGPPFVQLCGRFPASIKDTDTIITDVKFTNFKDTSPDSKYTWKPVNERCCAKGDTNCKYYPAYVVDPDNSDPNTAGEICTPGNQRPFVCAGNPSCNLMGVCISTDTWKNVKNGAKGIKNDDLYILSQPKGKPNCPVGMKSNGVDLHEGCNTGKSIYLCKK